MTLTMRTLFLAALLAFLSACVTVNIYFPAAAAEDAARTIVRDVLGPQSGGEAAPAPAPEKGSMLEPQRLMHLAGVVLHAIVPAAQAQQADININTPAIGAIRQSLRGRAGQLEAHFKSGALGLTRDGQVAVRALDAVSLKDRNAVQKLVADENKDRNALYREIARANGHPEWEQNIRDTFARVWVEEAPRGYWHQDAAGAWKQK